MKGIRSEILENIPMSILLVPFIALRYAGDYHVAAVVFGLAFFAVYAAAIYGYAGAGNKGFLELCTANGKPAKFTMLVYSLRFLVRAGFMVYVTSCILSQKNKVSFWVLAVSFILLCIYGAAGSLQKRRVLGNVLLWWMLAPIILLAVASIGRMNYGIEISLSGSGSVFKTAWKITAVMSTFELVLFSFAGSVKKESRQRVDIIRIAVWLVAAVLLAYVYVLGMSGGEYTEIGSGISRGNKVDYVLMLSWLIGAFYVISSYIFYAKEMMTAVASAHNFLLYGLIFSATLFFVCCAHYDLLRPYMINWLVYGDVLLSLLLPGILLMNNRKNYKG